MSRYRVILAMGIITLAFSSTAWPVYRIRVRSQPAARRGVQPKKARGWRASADSEMVAVTDGEDVETVLTGKPTYVLHAIPDDYGACLRQRIGAAKDALDVPVVEISIDADTGTGTLDASLVEESPAKTDPNLESCGGRICSNVVQEVRAQIEDVSSDVDTGTEVKSRFRVAEFGFDPCVLGKRFAVGDTERQVGAGVGSQSVLGSSEGLFVGLR